MTRIQFWVAIATLFVLSNGVCAADFPLQRPENVDLSATQLEKITPALHEFVDSGGFKGIVTLVARRGQVVYRDHYGILNAETGAAMEADSLFRIYSMTKPIVTVAAMALYEEGKFQLTDHISQYLPKFSDMVVLVDGERVPANGPITVQQIMSHTGGLTYGTFGNSEVDKLYREAGIQGETNLAEMMSNLSQLPLQYQPGTRWNYSVSTDVLARLIEVWSGKNLDAFLRERIFTPLAMEDTFFRVPENKIHRFGTNHQKSAEGQQQIIDRQHGGRFTEPVTFFSGGGGLLSTAEDYLRFCQMLLNGGELNGQRILGRKTIDYMTLNHLPAIYTNSGEQGGAITTRPGFGWGLGFAITTDPTASGTISSAGEYYWSGIAGTIFWIDPVEELIVISLVQQRGQRPPLRNTLKSIVYGAIVD